MRIPDFRELDDPALISERARLRADLEHMSPPSDAWRSIKLLLDAATQEIDHRARQAWTTPAASPGLLLESDE